MKEKHRRTVKIFKALSNPVRYAIIGALSRGERSVKELADELNKRQSLISQHLMILRNENLVRHRTVEHFVYYRLKNKSILSIISQVNAMVSRKTK